MLLVIWLWDVQVERQDLNKAGTPSPAWPLPVLKPIPAQAVPVQADVATLICRRCCGPVDRRHWVGGAKAWRDSVVWVDCGSVRPGVVLPCPGAHGCGRKARTRGLPGVLARGWYQPLPPPTVPHFPAVPTCFLTQSPSLTGETRSMQTPGVEVGWKTVLEPPLC